ncbi:protein O-mannosyl-transferase family [Melioribacter sp. OK-6-Me]|uniref:protein O-mannosyl-transferase family n=1 Tax=unclassified Melioribacter TaxID=2627329 RepID=UPI003ED8F885
MNHKLLNRIIAGIVFAISLFVFLITVQPSVSFWDCGEFIASSYALQVPHPPGTPFFLIVGRLFSMIPFAENIGLRVNLISVVTSAFTVMFLYLIAVMLIKNYRKKEPGSLFEALTVYIPAAIGALSLSFSDTFWFNAVEAEVYASSTFFIAFVVWLMMKWNEKADQPDNEKYILLIAYLIGLSTGVHLMAVLAIVPIVMIVVFRKYIDDEETLKKTAIIFLIHAAVVLVVAALMWASQTSSNPPTPDEYKDVDKRFMIVLGAISALIMAALYKKIFTRNSFYIPMILGGITLVVVYPGLVKYVPRLISLISGNDYTLNLITSILLFAITAFAIHWTAKNNKPTLNLVSKAFLLGLVGITTYAMIIIRANEEPPINMNSPKTFTELESYLNREQYGDFPTFKRRFSNEPHQMGIYTNYSSDLDFLWRYQMDHMFNRYLFWNYIGRVSTYQDSGVDWSDMYGIPFFIGLFGLFFHFRRDWKMASVFLVMFIFLGYLTAFYQNQQQPQPRERDYFYVGAFFVYSIWIALGMRGIIELIIEKFDKINNLKPFLSLIMVAGIIVVPVNMFHANYFEHNRSRNYVPWDYAYNLLQSAAPNAILFTNGDNDTFPLWYLQDVEGVRRDVRIANLSLLNTPWYIKQLKNTEPYGAPKVQMSLSDRDIDNLTVQRWEPTEMSIPVPPEVIKKFHVKDSTIIKTGKLTWLMKNPVQYGNIKAIRTQDLVVLDIIMQSKWERPIYFAITCSDDSKLGLDDYLRMEGMALRLVPDKSNTGSIEFINEPIMRKQLFDEPKGFSKDYRPGFKFRGLNDSTIFFDENHERLIQNYRNTFMRLAVHYLYSLKDSTRTVETLDLMEKKIPRNIVKVDNRILHDVARLYYAAGAYDKYKEIAKEVIETAKLQLKNNPRDYSSWNNPYDILLTHYENMKMYKEAVEVLNQLSIYLPYDESVKQLLNRYRRLAGVDTLEVK